MKKWQWVVLAIFSFLIFLALYMPAIYATNHIQKNSENAIKFEGVSGTLFEGRAKAISVNGMRLNNVKWDTSIWSLLILHANIEIVGGNIRNTAQIYAKGVLKVPLFNTQKISTHNATMFMPVKPLLAQMQLPVSVTASGRIKLSIEQFTFDQGCKELSGEGNWLQAAVNINNNPLTLGTFSANLACDTPNFAMQIKPDNGISLSANLIFDTTGKYGAKGTFVIPENFPAEIRQGAQFFAPLDSEGVYQLDQPFR